MEKKLSKQSANCNHTHGGNPTQRLAKLLQTALAAYRVILVGAAETGAGERQFSFDPIHDWIAFGDQSMKLGDTETGAAVTQKNPVHVDSGNQSAPGVAGIKTAMTGTRQVGL